MCVFARLCMAIPSFLDTSPHIAGIISLAHQTQSRGRKKVNAGYIVVFVSLSTFFLWCLRQFLSREGLDRSFPSPSDFESYFVFLRC